ncbi:MAG: LptF/LptG family permease, partial [Myxococcota bacterium]
GFDATPFWVDYHARLANPFACIVLPALALFFAVGGPPHPSPAQTLLVSGVLAVGYILLTAVSSSLGRGGVLAPVLSGWVPVGFFGTLALAQGARLWQRR